MTVYKTGPDTPRLILRAFAVDDAPAYLALRSHPDVIRHTGDPPMASEAEAREAIAQYPDFDTYGFGRWCCVLKENQRVIGFCGLKYLPELDEVDLGYRFLPEYWGRGLATEAGRASVAFGFDVLKLERIVGLVEPENAASIRVLEKVGMRRDGEAIYFGERALRFVIER